MPLWYFFVAIYVLTSFDCDIFPLVFFIVMVAGVVAAVTSWNNVPVLDNELQVKKGDGELT